MSLIDELAVDQLPRLRAAGCGPRDWAGSKVGGVGG